MTGPRGYNFDLAQAILAETDPEPGDPDYVPEYGRSTVGRPLKGEFKKRLRDQKAFLEAYARFGSITRAAKSIKLRQHTHYRWLAGDEGYKAAFQEASEQVGDMLEAEAIRRAVEGVDRPVFYQGEVVGHVTEYSDSLLKFLLRGLKPGRYLERVDITSRGQSLSIIIDGTAEVLPDRQLLLESGDGEDGEYVVAEEEYPEDDEPGYSPYKHKVVVDYERRQKEKAEEKKRREEAEQSVGTLLVEAREDVTGSH